LLGEAAILWFLTVQPEKGFPLKTGGSVPRYVYIVLTSTFLLGAWLILANIFRFRQAGRGPGPEVWAPKLQVSVWMLLLVGSAASFCLGHSLIAIAVLMAALVLPATKRKKTPKGAEDWPDDDPAALATQPKPGANS
jgi:hypothetical protein